MTQRLRANFRGKLLARYLSSGTRVQESGGRNQDSDTRLVYRVATTVPPSKQSAGTPSAVDKGGATNVKNHEVGWAFCRHSFRHRLACASSGSGDAHMGFRNWKRFESL